MADSQYVVFDAWVGGQPIWVPKIFYFGGMRVAIPGVDCDRISWLDVLDFYQKAGGKALSVEVYSTKPGVSLDKGLLILKGDKDLLELTKLYVGLPIIPLYFEDNPGPLLVVDPSGNVLSSETHIPLLPSNIDENVEVPTQPSQMGESSRHELKYQDGAKTSDESTQSDSSSCPSLLQLLLRDIGSPTEHDWTWISDRQKGIIEALHQCAPTNEHRFCLKHMYNNFKGRFRGLELKKWFWKAASTYNVKQHVSVMKKIQKICPKRSDDQTAFERMSSVPAKHWARCFFSPSSKCDVIVNNLSESFNSYILPSRDLPIIDMFEWIRRRCMTNIQVKKAGMERYPENICPNIVSKIEKQQEFSTNCFPAWAREDKYEVEHRLEHHIVHLRSGQCTCGFFQLCGYPCCHAMACISLHRLNVEDSVSDYFKKMTYLNVYQYIIHTVPGMHDFEESGLGPLTPPDMRMKRGRPKKKRRPDGNDIKEPTKSSRK